MDEEDEEYLSNICIDNEYENGECIQIDSDEQDDIDDNQKQRQKGKRRKKKKISKRHKMNGPQGIYLMSSKKKKKHLRRINKQYLQSLK